MNLINSITNQPLQQTTFVLPSGNSFQFTLYFVPMQYGWFITSLTYGSIQINSLRVTLNPNLLYQYQNLLPFGLGCFGNQEPMLQGDFTSGIAGLYVLTQAECQQYATFIQGGGLPS